MHILVTIGNVLKEYNQMKEEIKTLITFTVSQKISFICKTILSYCLECRKNSEQPKFEKIKKKSKMLSSNCAVCGSK